jgi:hypothetical protein
MFGAGWSISAEVVAAGVAALCAVGLGAGVVSFEFGSHALMSKPSASTARILIVIFVTLLFLKCQDPTKSRS